MSNNTSVDEVEINKFANLADKWWDKDGPLKTLHDINPARVEYINNFKALAGQRVLDIGCGGGILSEAMAAADGVVSAIDAEKNSLEIASGHARKSELTINYKCSAVEDYQDKPFNIVTCLEMLEHVQDPEMIITHAKRLLAKDGYLFLSTINRTIKSYIQVIVAAEYVLNLLPRQTHDFSKFIKPSELCALLRKHGFEIVDISGLSYNPLTRKAQLCDSVDTNYLIACRLQGVS